MKKKLPILLLALLAAVALPLTILATPDASSMSLTIAGTTLTDGGAITMQVGDSVAGTWTANNLELSGEIYKTEIHITAAPSGSALAGATLANTFISDFPPQPTSSASFPTGATPYVLDLPGSYTLQYELNNGQADGAKQVYGAISVTINVPDDSSSGGGSSSGGSSSGGSDSGSGSGSSSESGGNPGTPTPPDDYYTRHYTFWNSVYAQLTAMGNGRTLTVDADGYHLDHVQHFVFDALNGTTKTLVVKFEGESYRLAGGNLSGIQLGNNYSFSNLAGYIE